MGKNESVAKLASGSNRWYDNEVLSSGSLYQGNERADGGSHRQGPTSSLETVNRPPFVTSDQLLRSFSNNHALLLRPTRTLSLRPPAVILIWWLLIRSAPSTPHPEFMPARLHNEPAPLPFSYIAKIVSLGDSACGKSSLTVRLCEGRFSNTHDVTIGVEFGSRIVPVGPPANKALESGNTATAATLAEISDGTQKKMKLSVWDTAGQETYKSITRSYFRGASGALLVFDITRRKTFESVTSWLNDLRQIAEEGVVVVLVGNKLDLASQTTDIEGGNKREVTKQEAEEWCQREGVFRYVETSAKSGEGVERAFLEIAERIYQNVEAGKYDLNDRRSGVKSATGGREPRRTQTVNLGVQDSNGAQKSGCC